MYPLNERAFGKALAELGEKHPRLVVVDADLQRATETGLFQSRFPDRHFNVGVAEANMVGIATGLALSGKIAFCGTFACFATQRTCDQVVLAAYCLAPVVVFGVEPALTSGGNGATHQGMLDLAIMRAIPNMRVFEPGDATETHLIVEYILEHPGPTYLRVPRGKSPVIFDPGSYRFSAGKAMRVREGGDVTIAASGIMFPRALVAADELHQQGIEARVLNLSSIKPIDAEELLAAAADTGCIVTAENHNILGGVGAAVAEAVSGTHPVPVLRLGVQDVFGEVGPVDWLADKYEMGVKAIVGASRQAMALKERGPR